MDKNHLLSSTILSSATQKEGLEDVREDWKWASLGLANLNSDWLEFMFDLHSPSDLWWAMMHRDGYGDRNGDGSGDGKRENLKIMGTDTANIY